MVTSVAIGTGFVAALVIAAVARRLRALTEGGAVAATIAGTIAVAGGWGWAALLIAFFVSSTLLSRVRSSVRDKLLKGRVAKPGARDATQVLVNGGPFLVAAIAYAVRPGPLWQMAGVGALAAAAADTWATELGTLSVQPPRSILSGRTVHPGTSGGVTMLGFLGALGAAVFIGMVAIVAGWPWQAGIASLAGGLVGCVVDSLLGDALQVRRRCERCGMATEQVVHRCGTPTIVTGGVRWLNNDGVNAASTVVGALIGAGVVLLV